MKKTVPSYFIDLSDNSHFTTCVPVTTNALYQALINRDYGAADALITDKAIAASTCTEILSTVLLNYNNAVPLCKYCIKLGGDPTANNNKTIMDAVRYGYLRIVRLLFNNTQVVKSLSPEQFRDVTTCIRQSNIATSSNTFAYGGLRCGTLDICLLLADESKKREVFIVTARAYGLEAMYGAICGISNEIKCVTKVGINFDPSSPFTPIYLLESEIRQSSDLIPDLYACGYHRLPPNIDEHGIFRYAELLGMLQKEGLFKKTIISEPTASMMEDFHMSLTKVGSRLDFVEIAYSPFIRRAEKNNVLACAQLYGIRVFAYGVLLKGLLTTRVNEFIDIIDTATDQDLVTTVCNSLGISELDRTVGYFHPSCFRNNLLAVMKFVDLAKWLHMQPSELCVAYIKKKGYIPIMGSCSLERTTVNMFSVKEINDAHVLIIDDITQYFVGTPNPTALGYLDNPLLDNVS
jgi:aryl-alcohol dehydrogenase-like predicted oxidoreductase